MNEFIKNSKNKRAKNRDISFHYTNPEMVRDLIRLIPFSKKDIVLDAGSGKNKVWQKNCPVKCFECEIEDGCDFYEWNKEVDWVFQTRHFTREKIFF